jgi:hypothetical protein
MSEWIPVTERVPTDEGFPYQVLAICKKKYGPDSSYPGQGIKGVYQSWVIRRWPGNYTHWMRIPELTTE